MWTCGLEVWGSKKQTYEHNWLLNLRFYRKSTSSAHRSRQSFCKAAGQGQITWNTILRLLIALILSYSLSSLLPFLATLNVDWSAKGLKISFETNHQNWYHVGIFSAVDLLSSLLFTTDRFHCSLIILLSSQLNRMQLFQKINKNQLHSGNLVIYTL